MSRFSFDHLAAAHPPLAGYYGVLQDATREDHSCMYLIPDSLQIPDYTAAVLDAGARTEARAEARLERVSTLSDAGAIGLRVLGQAALLRTGVGLAQLHHIREEVAGKGRKGYHSIGIVPVSAVPALPEDWPLARDIMHEADVLVIQTPYGPRVVRHDGFDVVGVDTSQGQEETTRFLDLAAATARTALYGEGALRLIDQAIDRLAA